MLTHPINEIRAFWRWGRRRWCGVFTTNSLL